MAEASWEPSDTVLIERHQNEDMKIEPTTALQ